MKRIKQFQLNILSLLVVIGVIVIGFSVFLQVNIYLVTLIYLSLALIVLYTLNKMKEIFEELNTSVEANLNQNFQDAMDYADVGVLVYNNQFEISFQSELFKKNNLMHLGEKLFSWLPELQVLINGDSDEIIVNLNQFKYQVVKKDNVQVLLFKDVTAYQDMYELYDDHRLVLGYLNFDNYDESLESDDEQSLVINNLKQTVYEYLKKHDIVFKQIRNNRLFLILDEHACRAMSNDHFSILNTVRKQAQTNDLLITLSISLARGLDNYIELELLALDLLKLAQSRGGDQVAVRRGEDDVEYFGGSTEARESQSKVKVRVIANSLKDLIIKASNVIIVGHENADSDCVGSAIIMSKIATKFNKKVMIVNKSGGIEPMSAGVLKYYESELEKNHLFVSQNEALNHLNKDSLVIMVDHHSKEISGAKDILDQAQKVVVIDHHRRKSDFDVKTVLVYIEASASSTVELVCEFIPYTLKRLELTPTEANLGYLGIMIDTNHFKKRLGVRTFDVLSVLKAYGADPVVCEEFNKALFYDLMAKNKIISKAKKYTEGIVIADGDDNDIIERTIIAQACDEMVTSKDVDAAFVVCSIAENVTAISARSEGDFSVQVIMEKMRGGGHLSSAGLQRKDTTIAAVVAELKEKIDEYLKERQDESNNVE